MVKKMTRLSGAGESRAGESRAGDNYVNTNNVSDFAFRAAQLSTSSNVLDEVKVDTSIGINGTILAKKYGVVASSIYRLLKRNNTKVKSISEAKIYVPGQVVLSL